MMMKKLEKIAYIFVFTIVIAGVVASRIDLSFYEGFLVREDGPIEWLTVLALLFGGIVCFYRMRVLSPFRDKIFLLSLFLLGLLFLFGMGEELSWGQRLIGWESPNFFRTHNSQMETNFHNLVVDGKKINKIVFGTFLGIVVGLYFLVLPSVYSRVEKVKALVNKFAIPVPRLFHVLAYVALVGLVELIDGGKKGEILEFGGCWIFALLTLVPKNREIFSRVSLSR